MGYLIRKTNAAPALKGDWDGSIWARAATGELTNVRPESGDHLPRVAFRALYDRVGLYVIFRVEDRYVLSVVTKYNGPVCKDSCVEFFVKPKPRKGYFNFEINCGGVLHASYIEDPTRIPGGFRKRTKIPKRDGDRVKVFHSMPGVVSPEFQEPIVWVNEFHVPFALLEKYAGKLGRIEGQEWRANFYKCADGSSHPHWLSWSPVSAFNFHLPQCFGAIRFEP